MCKEKTATINYGLKLCALFSRHGWVATIAIATIFLSTFKSISITASNFIVSQHNTPSYLHYSKGLMARYF